MIGGGLGVKEIVRSISIGTACAGIGRNTTRASAVARAWTIDLLWKAASPATRTLAEPGSAMSIMLRRIGAPSLFARQPSTSGPECCDLIQPGRGFLNGA